MRNLARIGTALGAVAAVTATSTAPVSAAPSGYTVNVNHSTGALATSVTGKLSWSTSRRTVVLTDPKLFVRAGECAWVTFGGYQGKNRVTWEHGFQNQCAKDKNTTFSLGDIYLDTETPGGVEHVIIRLSDEKHEITRYANCYQSATACQHG